MTSRDRAVCPHVTWPAGSQPALWSVSAARIVTDEDRARMITVAAMSAADRGRWLDPTTVHHCLTRYGRAYWLAVTRPRLSDRRRSMPWWRMIWERLLRQVTPSPAHVRRHARPR